MGEQFNQSQFTSISALSQNCKGRDHPFMGGISFLEVTAFRTTTMLSVRIPTEVGHPFRFEAGH